MIRSESLSCHFSMKRKKKTNKLLPYSKKKICLLSFKRLKREFPVAASVLWALAVWFESPLKSRALALACFFFTNCNYTLANEHRAHTLVRRRPLFSTHRRPRKICNREASNSPVVVVVPETEKSETQSKSSLGTKCSWQKIRTAHQPRECARVALPSSGCGQWL